MTNTFHLPIRTRKELDAAKVLGATFETKSEGEWKSFDGYVHSMAGAIEDGRTATEMRAVFKVP